MPHCQMLVIHPAFNFIIEILPRDPKGQLRSSKLLSGATPCELVGDFISMYPHMSRDSVQPHGVLGRVCIDYLNDHVVRLVSSSTALAFLTNVNLHPLVQSNDKLANSSQYGREIRRNKPT